MKGRQELTDVFWAEVKVEQNTRKALLDNMNSKQQEQKKTEKSAKKEDFFNNECTTLHEDNNI